MQRFSPPNLMQGQLLRKPIISLHTRRRPAGTVDVQLSEPGVVPHMEVFTRYPTMELILSVEQHLMTPTKTEYRTYCH